MSSICPILLLFFTNIMSENQIFDFLDLLNILDYSPRSESKTSLGGNDNVGLFGRGKLWGVVVLITTKQKPHVKRGAKYNDIRPPVQAWGLNKAA